MPNGCCQRFPSKGCFDRKFRGFEEDTMTKFVVWTKDKAFGVEDPKPVSKKIKWKLQYVPFDGIPFMVVGRRVYSCHQGVDKHKHEKLTRQLQLLDDHSDHCYEERRRLQDSKKLDCPARIYVVHLIRFPDYKIPDDIHKQRKESAGRLRCALTKNPSAVKLEEQYVACFPRIEEHKNHPVVGEHFVDGRPTPAHPDPLPALTYDCSNVTPVRRLPKMRIFGRRRVDSKPANAENVREPVDTSSTPPSDSIISHKDTSKTQKRQRCESLLREISDLTYHLQDEPFLDSLTVRLNDLLEDVRHHTPHNDDTRPLSYTPPSKKMRYLETLSIIPKKHPSGKFGHRAEAMKASFKP